MAGQVSFRSISPEYKRIFNAVAEANIRQIAINCGKNPDSILEKILNTESGIGYNAVNGKYEDMIKAGIIEPFIVTKQVLVNAVSVANTILTSRYLIVPDLEDLKDNKN